MLKKPSSLAARLGIGALLCVPACDADDDGTGASDSSSSGAAAASTSAQTSGAGSGATAASGGAETEDADDPTGSSGQSEPPSAQEFEAMCSAIDDEATCEATNTSEFFDEWGVGFACNWETWVPVTIVDGECSFGEVQAGCVFESYGSDGCASWGTCDGGGLYTGVRDGEDGTLELGTSPQGWCTGPWFESCGSDPETDPPECACVCDDAWPGA